MNMRKQVLRVVASTAVIAVSMFILSVYAAVPTDGGEWIVDAEETLSENATVSRLLVNGSLTLAQGVEFKAIGSVMNCISTNDGIVANMTISNGASFTSIGNIDPFKDNSHGFSIGTYGGTGTVTVVKGGTLSVEGGRLILGRNNFTSFDRTKLSQGVLNVFGSVISPYIECGAWFPVQESGKKYETDGLPVASIINLEEGGVLETSCIQNNDTCRNVINFNGGILRVHSQNNFFLGASVSMVWKISQGKNLIFDTQNFNITLNPTLHQEDSFKILGEGGLVKRGAGFLDMRMAHPEMNTFSGAIVVEEGSLMLGRPLAEGQTVFVKSGAKFYPVCAADAKKISYEEATGAGLVFHVESNYVDGLDLLSLGDAYFTDKLGGPSGNWNGEVHGTITHASNIDIEHPFELVGKGSTLKLDGTGLENLPLTISGTGKFDFIGNRTNITDTAISFTGAATYQQSGNFYVRGAEGSMPVTTISGSGTVKTTGDLCVGYEGSNGVIKITDGAKVNVGGTLKIGCNLNSDSRPAVKGKMSIENATVTVSDIIYMGSNCSNSGEDRETLMNEIVLSKGATLCMGNRFVRYDDPRSRITFNGGALTAQFSHTEFFYSGYDGIFEVEAANGNDIKLNIGSYSIGATCNHTHFFGTGGLDIQGKEGSSAKFILGKAGLTDFSVEYSGDTKITDATLVLGVPLPSGGKIIGTRGTLQLDNVTITNTFEGDIKVTGNGAIVVGVDGKDCILDVPVEGPDVIKVGAGTLTLSNNFNGKLVVKEGSVNVRGIAYKSYRFKIEGIRGPNPDAVQLSELKMFDGKNDVTRPYSKLEYDSNGAVANNIYPAKESPNNIVDGSTSTKWLDWRLLQSHPESDHDRVWLRIDYPSLRRITGYAWYTANDYPIRDPFAWRLQGSNDDGVTWEDIDVQTGYAATESRKALAGTFNNLGALGSSGRIVVESGGKLRVVAGAISSAAIINEGGEVELSQGASIVSEGGILDGGVSGSGSVDVIGGSVALKGEQSYKGTTHVKSGTLSIGVAANAAERASFNGKYFRLTLKRSNNNGARLDYKNGNKVANGAGAMQASEFQLYDANGNNVAKGLSKVAEGTSATSLAPGKFAPAAVYTYGVNEGADKLFDGDTGTKCNMTVPVSRKDSSTWRVFTMRLADTASAVVSYNFYTANDYVRRSPTDWKLEGSQDGIVWETLDERFFAPNAAWSTITKATAYNEPTLVKKPFNNGTPFKFQERIQQPQAAGKFFRFTFKKTHGNTTFQLSELQLLDGDGNNVASGLVKVQNKPLSAGTFVDGGSYNYGNNEGSDKLFDDNPDTKMCAVNNNMDGTDGKYRVFTLCLADNAAPVCGYNFVAANDFPVDRSPSAWKVEGSDDGETWTLLDERTDEQAPFSVYASINHGKPYAFTQKIEKGEIPGDSFVIVDGGATLRLDDPNATIGALRIDCAAGAGAIECFHPAARGKIELINVPDDFLCSNYIVPIDIKGVKNITNLNTWVVTINGKLSNVRARYRNGSIVLLHAGLTVTIR